MIDHDTRAGGEELQFDRVISESTSSAPPSRLAVICAVCQTPSEAEYFDVNGSILCSRCRTVAESAAEAPRGFVALMTAGVYGLVAGVFGAIIYYVVIAIAHLEIGIVAVLIGYMVGYAVRTGARDRGALRFQVLAIALTYASIALAYTPIVVKQAVGAGRPIRVQPAHRVGEPRLRRADARQEDVGARVDDEGHAGGRGRVARRSDPVRLDGELPAESRKPFRIRLSAAADAAPGVRLVAFDATLDGRRYGEIFDAVVEITR